MELSNRFTTDLVEFEKAFEGFKKTLTLVPSNYTDVEADAIKNGWLQKFEYCTELAWKLGKTFLEWKTGSIVSFPKGVYRELYLSKQIDEDLCKKLFDTINDRNKMSHIYKEEMFLFVIENIQAHKNTFSRLIEVFKNFQQNTNTFF